MHAVNSESRPSETSVVICKTVSHAIFECRRIRIGRQHVKDNGRIRIPAVNSIEGFSLNLLTNTLLNAFLCAACTDQTEKYFTTVRFSKGNEIKRHTHTRKRYLFET